MNQLRQGCFQLFGFFVGIFIWFWAVYRAAGAIMADWIIKIYFYSLTGAAFFATLGLGLQPMTAQNIANVFVGMNFITICIIEGIKTDRWYNKLLTKEDAEIEKATGLADSLIWGDKNLQYSKLKNDHARLEDKNTESDSSVNNEKKQIKERE